MEFLPWQTVDLDGAFRVTAPESIAEEVIQEVGNAVTFRFRGDLSDVQLEILLAPPFRWQECFPAHEQEDPPVLFLCRLISRSTGRRRIVPLSQVRKGLWRAEVSHAAHLEGEEIRAEALMVREQQASPTVEGFGCLRGQILGRSRIHVVRFSARHSAADPLFHLRWSPFPSGRSQQLFRLLPGEPPTIELNEGLSAPLRRLLMSRSRRRSGGALLRDSLFSTVCATVWPVLVSGVLHDLDRIIRGEGADDPAELIEQLTIWQRRLLGLFAPGLAGVDLEPHLALPHLVRELSREGGFSTVLLRLPPLIQQETRLVMLAEAMAVGAHLSGEDDRDAGPVDISDAARREVA